MDDQEMKRFLAEQASAAHEKEGGQGMTVLLFLCVIWAPRALALPIALMALGHPILAAIALILYFLE